VTEFGQVSAALRAVDIAAVSDAACSLQYDVDFDPGTMLCAIGPGKDACFGDSGGPLTRQDRVLTGLVSWGPESCGGAEGPGVYTELADADINAFARFSGYAPPQNSGAPPAFEGAPQAGEPVSCAPGGWTGGPDFDYRFEQDGPLRVLARDWSSSPSFTPTGAEVGRKLRCLVRARGDGGAAIVTSEASAAVLEGAPTLTSATADPATAGRGQSVTLSATAADPDSAQDELLYTWDLEGDGFGPGDPTGATVTTSFATAGDKTVPVRVTDEGGRADTGQATLTVVAEVAPQITALSVPATARRLTEVTLSATVTAGTTPADQLRFLWDLDGDGAYDDAATGSTPSVTTTLDGPTGPRTVGVEVRDRTAPIELFERARRTLEVLPASTVPLAPPAGGDPPARASDATPPALRITRVRRSGTRALVTVACPGEPCAGTLTLRTAGKVRTGSGRRVLVVGRAPFRITGAARVVRVRLSSGARRLLRRGSLRVVASARARDDAGNTASRTARGTLRRG
jgi:hypothetical protein